MFTLDSVVLWGRSFDEYRRMFALDERDVRRSILGCGDGPASFNAEATRLGAHVVSCDPIYRFERRDIEDRILAGAAAIVDQTRRNADAFVWSGPIRTVDDLCRARMTAMRAFLRDYDAGRAEGRYVEASLPALPFQDDAFDLAVCSHLLFLYSSQLDEAFHRAAVRELRRVAADVRVFPLLALDGTLSSFVTRCLDDARQAGADAAVETVPYEFQRGANQMLRIRRERPSHDVRPMSRSEGEGSGLSIHPPAADAGG